MDHLVYPALIYKYHCLYYFFILCTDLHQVYFPGVYTTSVWYPLHSGRVLILLQTHHLILFFYLQ